MAPNLQSGAVYLIQEGESWLLVKFTSFVRVTEVEFLRDTEGNPVSNPIRRIQIADSNPHDDAKLYARVNVCLKGFATEQEAEAFAAKADLAKQAWTNDVIRDPVLLKAVAVK